MTVPDPQRAPAALRVPVDGGELRGGTWQSTDPTAPTVVAVHGITSNHLSWAKVARLLAAHDTGPLSVAAPDLRGRVLSAGLPGPWGLRRHAADVVAVLDHLRVERCVLVGHSMGAWVVALAAEAAPHRVAGLVLVDGGVSLPLAFDDDTDPDEVMAAVLGPALARLAKTYPDRDAYLAEWAGHPAFGGGLDRDQRACLMADLAGSGFAWRSTVVAEAVRADGTDLVVDHHVRDALARTSCPAVLVRAERGLLDDDAILLPPAAVDPLLAARPDTSLVDAPGTNHYTVVMGDHGAAVTAEVIRDLTGASSR